MQPDDVRRALVVGAGAMGPGIAQVYATAGYPVDLVDTRPEALDRARSRVCDSVARLASWGAFPVDGVEPILGRVNYTTDLAAVAPAADVVTEAIVEDRQAKRDLFEALDGLLKPEAIVTSNTSGLDVFELLRDVIPQRLSRVVIHHYFLPAPVVPLVEVVAGPSTDPAVLDFSVRLLERLGRVPVVLRNFRPNFIVNSVQVAVAAVVAELLAEGVATPEEVDRAVKASLGIRLPVVGVAQSLDFTGLDLITRILRHCGRDASFFEALVARGQTGAREGRGLFDYGGRDFAEVEAERDRKYWAHYQSLKEIGAFEPL